MWVARRLSPWRSRITSVITPSPRSSVGRSSNWPWSSLWLKAVVFTLVEEGVELIELFLRNRVVLVGVTLRATKRQALRTKTRLCSALSGAIPAYPPDSPVACSRVSMRKLACRTASSGRWHAKQFLDRIGRMSVLKSTPTLLAPWSP